MAMNNFGAGFVLNAYDKTSTVLKQVSTNLSNMFRSGQTGMDLLNKSIARRDIGAAMQRMGGSITGAIGRMGDSAEAVNRVVQNVRALRGESEATGAAMRAQIRSDAISKLGFTADQAANAMQTLTLSGNDADSSMKALDATLRFARIGMVDVSQAGGMMDAMLDIFGGTMADSTTRVDKMAWAMRQFGLNGQQVSTLMQFTASSAQLVGASFDDMLMATSMVGTVIPQTERAASAVNMAFQQLASEDVQKKLKGLGVEVTDGENRFKGLSAVLVDLMKGMDGLDEAARATKLKEIFGSRSAGGMMTIIKQLEAGVKGLNGEMLYGADAAAFLAKQMGNTTGMAQKMAEEMTTARDKLAAATDRMRKSLGDAVEDLMNPLRELGASVFNKIADAINALPPELKQAILGIASALGAFLTITGGLIVFTTVMDQLGLSMKDLVFRFIKVALIVGPLTVLFAGLGVGFYAAYKAMSRAGGPMVNIVDKLRLGWKAALEMISTGKLSDATKKALGSPENSGVARFVKWFEGLMVRWDAFWTGFKDGWDQGVAALGPSIDAFMAKLGTITDMFDSGDPSGKLDEMGKMGRGAGSALAKLGEIGIQVMSALLDFLPPIINYFKGLTGEDISNGINSLVEGFRAMVAVITVVGRAIGGLWNLLQFLGTRIGELAAMWVDMFMSMGSALDSALSGDFAGAGIKLKNFGLRAAETLTGTSEAQSGQISDMVSALSGGEFGGSKGDKKFYAIQNKDNKIREMVSEYRSAATAGGGEEEIRQRLLTQKGDKESLRHDAALIKELSELRAAIKQLAGKDLIAQIETVTVAKAAQAGAAHEAGRSLAPMPVGF